MIMEAVSKYNGIITYPKGKCKTKCKIIQQRKTFTCDYQTELKLTEKLKVYGKIIIFPIIVDSDLLGGIIIISESDVQTMQLVAKTIFELVKKYFI